MGLLSRAYRKVRGWFARPTTQSRPESPDAYEPPDGSEVLVIAAKGDVFDLHLIPYFRWTSEEDPHMSYDTLVARSKQYVEPARGRLLRIIWSTARGFGPSQLTEAENAINGLDAVRKGWCYNDREGKIRCTPTVRVMLDPRLREHLLPISLNRTNLDEHARYLRARAEYTQELTLKWLGVIDALENAFPPPVGRPETAEEEVKRLRLKAERQFLVPAAALLSDKEFAVVMRDVAQQRQEKATDLVAALHEASRIHDGVGLFEFAKAYDLATQTYAQQLGLGPFRWSFSDMNTPVDPEVSPDSSVNGATGARPTGEDR